MTTYDYTSFKASGMDAPKIYPEKQLLSPTAFLRSRIADFARQADGLANKILPQTIPHRIPKYHKHHHYDEHHHYDHHHHHCYPLYQPHSTVILADKNTSLFSSRDSSSKKDDGSAVLAAIAMVIGMTTLYFIGTGLSSLRDTEHEANDTKSINELLNTFSKMDLSKEDQLLICEAKRAALITQKIYDRTNNSTLNGLYLKAGLVTSCATSFMGFWANSSAVQYFAVPFAMFSIGGLILKAGVESTNEENIRDAKALKSSIHQLNLLQIPQKKEEPKQA
jgi:hypothetical protein